ncbi:MAG: alkaline phosphatase family protein [Acidobacteria bacterium]|nr:alkaline phosphatase family protein [Acidobacteriota bacterium]
MNRRSFFLACGAASRAPAQAPAPAPRRPKLVLALVIDQFRFDYLYRFRSEFTGGLLRLWQQGAVFTNAFYEHAPTVTAIGHSTFLSGATPAMSGVIGNEWYDRDEGEEVTSVSDKKTRLLGGKGDGAGKGSSPRRLLVSTLGDELKMSSRGKPKVVGVSIKDRSAILPSGHMADGAYWFDNASGNFVSSDYYFSDMPGWAKDFNRSRSVDKFMGAKWTPIFNAKAAPFETMPSEATEKYWRNMQRTPYGNDIVEAFAEAAVTGERLGQGNGPLPDVLAVSFSSNDYVGHDNGPDSPQVHDVTVRTDRVLAKLFQFLDAKVGMANILVVLTADHGVAPVPEVNAARKMPGGRGEGDKMLVRLDAYLDDRFAKGEWIPKGGELPSVFLNHKLITNNRLPLARVRAEAAAWIRANEKHVQRVYTWEQLAAGSPGDLVDQRVRNGFHAQRASDLYVVIDPYWLPTRGPGKGTTHGAPYNYDAHVPVIFMGPGVKPGRYHRRAAPNDIAPTLATMLEVETPSGSVGRVLDEMMR